MTLIAPQKIASALAVLIAGLLPLSIPAGAAPLRAAAATAANTRAVIQVRDRWVRHHRPYRRYWDEGTYVRAPFTRVETWRSRGASVDAPFASVRVHPYGTWVRAPFVDIFVPR